MKSDFSPQQIQHLISKSLQAFSVISPELPIHAYYNISILSTLTLNFINNRLLSNCNERKIRQSEEELQLQQMENQIK